MASSPVHEKPRIPQSKAANKQKSKVPPQGSGGQQALGMEIEAQRLWQHPFVNIFKYCGVERWTDAHHEGDVQLYIDRTIGKVCYRISGSIPAKNFLQVPKKKTDSLGLTGRYLYAMICVHPSKLFVMHFDLVVEEGFTVRLSISNIFKADEQDTKTVKLCYKPPSDKWTVLALDLRGILKARTGRVFRCLKGMQICSRMLVKNAYTSDTIYDPQTLPRDMMLLQTSRAEQVTAWQWLPGPPSTESTPSPSVHSTPRPSAQTTPRTSAHCTPKPRSRLTPRSHSRLATLSPEDCKENVEDSQRLPPPEKHRKQVMKAGPERMSGIPIPEPLLAKPPERTNGQAGPAKGHVITTKAAPKQGSSLVRGSDPSRLDSDPYPSAERDPLLGVEARARPDFTDAASDETASQSSRQEETEKPDASSDDVRAEECTTSTRVRVVRHDPGASTSAQVEEADVRKVVTSADASDAAEARDLFMVEEPRAAEGPADDAPQPGVSPEGSGLGPDPVMVLEKVVGFSGQRTGSVLYAPDGSSVVFPSSSTIIAMDPVTGSQRFLLGHSAPVCALAFDAKGTVLASAQEGKHAIIRVWDFASGTCLAVLMAHASGLTSVDVSADGKALLGVGLDQHARQLIIVWDITPLPGGSRAVVLARHTTDHHVLTARFSPLEENHLMTCGRNSIRMYRLKNGQLKGCSVNLAEHRQQALLKHIDTGSPAETVFTDLAYDLGYGLTEFPKPPELTVQLYEKRVYVSTTSGSVFQVIYGKLTVERVHHLHTEPIHSLSVTEGFCITGSGDGRLRVWPLEFSEFFMEMELEGEVVATSVRADGLHVAFGTKSGSVGVLDVGNHRNQTLLRSHIDKVVALALDPLQPQFTTISADRTVRIWALESMEQLYEFDAPGDCPTCLAYHPRERVIACGFLSGMVRVFAIENTTLVHERRQHRGPVTQVLFLSSGDQLVSSGAEGNLCIYDATREYAPAKILATPVARRHVAMTATGDGSELATVARDGMSIVLYNTLDWAQVPRTFPASSGICKLAFSPDGRSLFAVTTDLRLEKYDVASRKLVGSVADIHRGDCHALAVSGDGALLATGGNDRLVKVWKADLTGASQSFAGQNGAVLCAAFSNQPTPCLLSVGEANAIVRWRLSTLAVREPLG